VRQYLDLLRRVLTDGVDRPPARPGQPGTRAVFGHQLRFDLPAGFPLVTTKELPFRKIAGELLWHLSGSTNVRDLHAADIHVWDAWADGETGDLGPIYGAQWRRWPAAGGTGRGGASTIDQIERVVREIRRNPSSRRLLVSAWNVADLPRMALAPCHFAYQFWVGSGTLSCQVYQRSADVFIGLPWNIAQYALLTMMVAQVCELRPGVLVHTLGDAHLYRPHVALAKAQLRRRPHRLPTVTIEPNVRALGAFTPDHFTLLGYRAHPRIRAHVAV
jgi:thymidylate synthase